MNYIILFICGINPKTPKPLNHTPAKNIIKC